MNRQRRLATSPVINSAWICAAIKDRVVAVNCPLSVALLLFFFGPFVIAQTAEPSDCSTLKYLRQKVSCLCGTVQICSGDVCGRPSDYDLDNDITVELKEKKGTILDSKKVVVETHEKQGTTLNGIKTPYKETEQKFCFEGKGDGDYLLAFVLHRNGIPQPAVIFPMNYSHKRRKACNSVYMVEPSCPR